LGQRSSTLRVVDEERHAMDVVVDDPTHAPSTRRSTC
jgi:hypothetical protein